MKEVADSRDCTDQAAPYCRGAPRLRRSRSARRESQPRAACQWPMGRRYRGRRTGRASARRSEEDIAQIRARDRDRRASIPGGMDLREKLGLLEEFGRWVGRSICGARARPGSAGVIVSTTRSRAAQLRRYPPASTAADKAAHREDQQRSHPIRIAAVELLCEHPPHDWPRRWVRAMPRPSRKRGDLYSVIGQSPGGSDERPYPGASQAITSNASESPSNWVRHAVAHSHRCRAAA